MSIKIGAISLGRASKKYTHDMSFDNNTTMGFGFLQPLCSQLMYKGDKISLSAKQLVRLAPMPVPSFARIKAINRAFFVPMSDVFPAWDALLAHQTVSTTVYSYIPQKLPRISNRFLAMWLIGCYGYYGLFAQSEKTAIGVTSNKIQRYPQHVQAFKVTQKIASIVGEPQGVLSTGFQSDVTGQVDDTVTIDGSDFLIVGDTNHYNDSAAPTDFDIVAVKLNDDGKHVYTILRGLGYSLDLADDNLVSAVPIMAFYKAWFDHFAPKRYLNWSSTPMYQLINYVYENGDGGSKPATNLNMTLDYTVSAKFTDAHKVLSSLAECWFTESDDFYSVHTMQPYNNASISDVNLPQPTVNSAVNQAEIDTVAQNSLGSLPFIKASGLDASNTMTQIAFDTLKRLSRFVSKNSIIGTKIDDYLKTHFGFDASSDFFKDSYDLGAWVTNCDINDVFSAADTASGSGDTASGDFLGSYAGKGIGFADGRINYEASACGYFFIMSAIVPKAGYFQGDDLSLYGVDRYTLPSPEFDALGYELTPLAGLIDYNGEFDKRAPSYADATDKAFGYIPRFSGYKIKKNIVNGDMALRSVRDSLSPYHLNRIITKQKHTVTSAAGVEYLGTTSFVVPSASVAWRYPTRYDYLGNFNRIFYNEGYMSGSPSDIGTIDSTTVKDDNFIVQTVFDIRLTNCLKPISMSYDTYDESVDNSTRDVRAE
uniref:Major capsid protein n=1 Tax=Dulem virus 260 TaxID=3145737 RepID=A0AAU8B8V4_9VIRU